MHIDRRLMLAWRSPTALSAPQLGAGRRHDQGRPARHLRRSVHRARRGRQARRETGVRGGTTAWPAARRSRSSRARPTPRRTAPSRPRASWSSRMASQILVGPLSGDEGLAVKDYAKTQPDVTFINGTSAAQDTTLRDPAPNFFRFSTDGAQWMAGLGDYAFNEQGLQEGRDRRRGLFVPLHPGVRLHGRVLQGRRPCAVEILGADRQQGLLIGHRRDPRRRRCDLCGARRRRRASTS